MRVAALHISPFGNFRNFRTPISRSHFNFNGKYIYWRTRLTKLFCLDENAFWNERDSRVSINVDSGVCLCGNADIVIVAVAIDVITI